MRRSLVIPALAVAVSCAASSATAQSTPAAAPAGATSQPSQGKPRLPANRGTSEGQSGMSSPASAVKAPAAASSARSKNARLPAVRKKARHTAPTP